MLVLLHELGHATFALLYTSGTVQVQVGGRRPLLVAEFGRLQVGFTPTIIGGYCRSRSGEASRWQRFAIVSAGPAVNLFAALILLSVPAGTGDQVLDVLHYLGALSLLQAIWNLIPHNTFFGSGGPSDGLQLLRLLTGRPLMPGSGQPWTVEMPDKEGRRKRFAFFRSRRTGDAKRTASQVDPDFKACPQCGEVVPLMTRECVCEHLFEMADA